MTNVIMVIETALGLGLLTLAGTLLRKRSTTARGGTVKRVLLAVPVALAGAGMLAATMEPFLAFFSAALSVVALAAVHAGARLASARGAFFISGTIGAAALAVAVLQPLGLKVLLLPKAAALAFEAAPAKLVKLYPEGVWFEGIAAGPDGTLYLAANRNLDFSTGRYYRDAVGEVIARAPDGKERTLFRTPLGTTAGVIAVDSDGTLYMTSNGDAPAIWRIEANGRANKLATLPSGAWPNGIDFGPDGLLYSPDSNLARVWRIDPRSGEATIAVEDKRLAARPYIALAPGANGLHFAGRDMIITVSDSTEVLRYRLGEDGRFDRPALVANGIPGDDFAIGHDGSLFITTHPYNTLVRMAPEGRRTIIANEKQQVIGATDAVFGRGAVDKETLYVVTDGGAFTGGSETRGALIAVRPYAR